MLTTFSQCNFSLEFPGILSRNHICYLCLRVSGISKIMHCGILINLPYLLQCFDSIIQTMNQVFWCFKPEPIGQISRNYSNNVSFIKCTNERQCISGGFKTHALTWDRLSVWFERVGWEGKSLGHYLTKWEDNSKANLFSGQYDFGAAHFSLKTTTIKREDNSKILTCLLSSNISSYNVS